MVRLLGNRSASLQGRLQTYVSYNDPMEWKGVEESSGHRDRV